MARHFLLVAFTTAVTFFWGASLISTYALKAYDRYLDATSFLLLFSSLLFVFSSYGLSYKRINFNYVSRQNRGFSSCARSLVYFLVILTTIPAAFYAFTDFKERYGVSYLDMNAADPIIQLFSYLNLYVYLLFLALAEKGKTSARTFFLVFLIVISPKLLVASIAGRFAAVMPIVAFLFIGFARGYIKVKIRYFVFSLIVGFWVLIIQPLFRGGDASQLDGELVLQVLMKSGPVNLMTQLDQINALFPEVNFLKTGLLGNIFPSLMNSNETADLWRREGLAITADRAFAIYEGATFDSAFGPGSIYVGELYLIGGWIGVALGSLLLGFLMAFTQKASANPSVWLFPLLDFAIKVPFIPRSNLTYMFERLVPLYCFSFLFICTVYILVYSRNKIDCLGEYKIS